MNAKKDLVADQKKIVNNFYNNGKFVSFSLESRFLRESELQGKPKANQKVLSPYDDKDYSKKKLLALVDQVKISFWWPLFYLGMVFQSPNLKYAIFRN